MTDRPPRFLHVFPTFALGGAQRRLAQLANRAGAAIEHTILALDGQHDAAAFLAPSVPRTLGSAAGPGGLWPNLRDHRARLEALKPDLLLTYNWGAIEWALAGRGLPWLRHVHHEDGFGPDEAGGRLKPRRNLFRRLALGGPHTRVMVPSRGLETIARHHWGVPARRLVRIVNGVDVARFATPGSEALRRAAVAGVTRAPGLTTIVAIGALRAEKNFARLVRALPNDPGVRLVLAGDGPERQRLEALARERGLAPRVILPGTLPAEGVLAAGDLFALSSDTEQLPISLLEAMAAGLPVVATDVGDVAWAVSDVNRPLVVPPGDEAGYAAALARVLADAALRQTLGAANAAKARSDFTEAAMAQAYGRLYGWPVAGWRGEA